MLELPKHPPYLALSISIKPDISIAVHYDGDNYTLWQINLRHKVAYNYSIYLPNQNYWNYNHHCGISEQEEGLCWWNGHKWQLFELEVQEAYSGFIAEKEILS